jgi:hypothetical protein
MYNSRSPSALFETSSHVIELTRSMTPSSLAPARETGTLGSSSNSATHGLWSEVETAGTDVMLVCLSLPSHGGIDFHKTRSQYL